MKGLLFIRLLFNKRCECNGYCGFGSVESGFTNKYKENNSRSTQGIYSLHTRSRHVVRMYIGPQIMPRKGMPNYNNGRSNSRIKLNVNLSVDVLGTLQDRWLNTPNTVYLDNIVFRMS